MGPGPMVQGLTQNLSDFYLFFKTSKNSHTMPIPVNFKPSTPQNHQKSSKIDQKRVRVFSKNL